MEQFYRRSQPNRIHDAANGRRRDNPQIQPRPATALRRSVAPLIIMALIFWLSHQPAEPVDRSLLEILVRKGGHVTGYLALTLAWAWTLVPIVRRTALAAATIALLWAISDEYHQTFVEGRNGTVADVGIDALGIALALLIWARARVEVGPGRPRGEDRPAAGQLEVR